MLYFWDPGEFFEGRHGRGGREDNKSVVNGDDAIEHPDTIIVPDNHQPHQQGAHTPQGTTHLHSATKPRPKSASSAIASAAVASPVGRRQVFVCRFLWGGMFACLDGGGGRGLRDAALDLAGGPWKP
jgi:hypothetical protein